MAKMTLKLIQDVDKEQKCLTTELGAAVALFARDDSNSIADRAAALRIACQYMPRKQGDLTDEQFVNSFLRGDTY